MSQKQLTLIVLTDTFAICRFDKDAGIPDWAKGSFCSITRTDDELSIVCEQGNVPIDVQAERGWRCLKVVGPLDFALTGIVARLTAPLAAAGISVSVIATYDTDYLLVKVENLKPSIVALRQAGHMVE